MWRVRPSPLPELGDWPWRYVVDVAWEGTFGIQGTDTWFAHEHPGEALFLEAPVRVDEDSRLRVLCAGGYWRGPTGERYDAQDLGCEALPRAAGCRHASSPISFGSALLALVLLGLRRLRAI